MAKVNPIPNAETLRRRRKIKWIIDPKEVSDKNKNRIRQWAGTIMKQYESKLTDKLPEAKIIWRGEVSPEELDVRNIYPFGDLHWMISRHGCYFCLMICSDNVILAKMTYAFTHGVPVKGKEQKTPRGY